MNGAHGLRGADEQVVESVGGKASNWWAKSVRVMKTWSSLSKGYLLAFQIG